jgi:hypothetical protein
MRLRKKPLLGIVATLGLGGVMATSMIEVAPASSHREAPLITEDPVADNTDTYAFVSPDQPDKVTLIGNWIPLEEPAGGPNFNRFGDEVLYELNVDNDGDSFDDITYEFRFRTSPKVWTTFLYNTGPISAVLDGNGNAIDYSGLNLQQSYTVTEVRDGQRTTLGRGLLTPPANIGPRSTPDYASLANAAIYELAGGINVFAGPRDDPFFVDLGSVFDLGGLRPFNTAHAIPLPTEPGKDEVQGYNTHTIAIQVPIDRLTDGDPVIGVYSTTSRRQSRVFADATGYKLQHSGPWVQVSRLGMPLVNEVVIPLGRKDVFNAVEPNKDSQFLTYVNDPELGRLIPQLYPNVFSCFPTAPRDDLVSIFLTGIPGVNQPANVVGSEMIRLNTSIPPTPFDQQDRLGLLAGQLDGFPNGRRLVDDVTDIELQAVAGATPVGSCNGISPNNLLGDGVDANDMPFMSTFPYLALPAQGYQHTD